MSAIELLAVPSAVLVTLGLLLLTVWLERHVLSARSLITLVVRVRNKDLIVRARSGYNAGQSRPHSP